MNIKGGILRCHLRLSEGQHLPTLVDIPPFWASDWYRASNLSWKPSLWRRTRKAAPSGRPSRHQTGSQLCVPMLVPVQQALPSLKEYVGPNFTMINCDFTRPNRDTMEIQWEKNGKNGRYLEEYAQGSERSFCALSVNRSLIFQTHKAMSGNMFFSEEPKVTSAPCANFAKVAGY